MGSSKRFAPASQAIAPTHMAGTGRSPAPSVGAARAVGERRLSGCRGSRPAPARTAPTADVAISEYGAAIWCDPFAWIPEAHRLLRAGGVLPFSVLTRWPWSAPRLTARPHPKLWCGIGSLFIASTGGMRSLIRAASSSPCTRARGSACSTASASTSLITRSCRRRTRAQANRSAPPPSGPLPGSRPSMYGKPASEAEGGYMRHSRWSEDAAGVTSRPVADCRARVSHVGSAASAVLCRYDLNSRSRPHCCRSSAPRIAVPMTGSKALRT